jgi:PAS domain S-box-containing protein
LCPAVFERKHAEAERLKFQLGIERSADAIFLADLAGKIVYVNPAFEKIYGYYRDDLRGKTPRVLKSGVHSQQFYEQFWHTLLSKEIVAGEIVNRASDGRLLHIEGSANPIINDAGEITGFLAIQRDVTERKRSEELLLTIPRGVSSATGESFFRSLVEQLGKALGADVVFVGELVKTTSARIRTLAVHSVGQIAENFEFELNGSPCERLLGEKQCSYPGGIRNLFPLDRMLAELKAEGCKGHRPSYRVPDSPRGWLLDLPRNNRHEPAGQPGHPRDRRHLARYHRAQAFRTSAAGKR